MVAWWWLIVALFAGVGAGYFCAALMFASAEPWRDE